MIDIKIKKSIAELGHNGRLKIYVNPKKFHVDLGIYVHSNDLISETTAPMILKFHMQPSMTRLQGFSKIKFRLLGNQIWPLLLKIAKPLKSTFPPEPLDIFG